MSQILSDNEGTDDGTPDVHLDQGATPVIPHLVNKDVSQEVVPGLTGNQLVELVIGQRNDINKITHALLSVQETMRNNTIALNALNGSPSVFPQGGVGGEVKPVISMIPSKVPPGSNAVQAEPASTRTAHIAVTACADQPGPSGILPASDAMSVTSATSASERWDIALDPVKGGGPIMEVLDPETSFWEDGNAEYVPPASPVGPEVHSAAASAAKSFWAKKMDDVHLAAKLKDTPVPVNCGFLEPKPMNKTIFCAQALPYGIRTTDKAMQDVQQVYAAAATKVLAALVPG